MVFRYGPGAAVASPGGTVVSLRCPACRIMGTFESSILNLHDLDLMDSSLAMGSAAPGSPAIVLGQRSCPNPACRAHVFFAYDAKKRELLISYPAERIDFDAAQIPDAIVAAFEEVITCHANRCFIAAAIMVRKTLELLCSDRNAEGSNLKERVKNLSATLILPKELVSGLDYLRLLGNDAAHIESKEYAKVDQEEVEVAIELTKEVLKGVYQYSAFISRLEALKKRP